MNHDTPILGGRSLTASNVIFFPAAVAASTVIIAAAVERWVPMPPIARVAVTLLPLPFYAWFVAVAVRAARRLDEMWMRIQVEALAVTAIGTALVAFTVGQLQDAKVGLPNLEWGWLWVVMTAFYALALARAVRHYR